MTLLTAEPQSQLNGFGVTPLREVLITVSTEERLPAHFSAEVARRYQELCGADPSQFTLDGNNYQNGMQSSLAGFKLEDGKVSGILQPTRYGWGQVSRLEIVERQKTDSNSSQIYEAHSANMANTWLVSFAKFQGEWHLVGQIKGAGVFGGGQLHPALAAGGVSAKLIHPETQIKDILLGNILKEASEEGAPLSGLKRNAQIAFALDERFQGSVVFGYAGQTDIAAIKETLSRKAAEQFAKKGQPEADGQALYNPVLGDRLFIKVEGASASTLR